MREVHLLLDLLEGARHRSGDRVRETVERLCRGFGGCSFTIGSGCWWHEGVFVFDPHISYAVSIEKRDWPAFRWLGAQLAKGQETVYLVSPFGEAEIIDLAHPPAFDANSIAFRRAFRAFGQGRGPIDIVVMDGEMVGARPDPWLTASPGSEFDEVGDYPDRPVARDPLLGDLGAGS